METAIWKLEDIRPAPYNPRVTLKPGDAEYDALDKSLQRFGLAEPLVINKATGLLVSGHQRLNVLKAQGAEEAEVVLIELDPEQEKLLNVAINKIDGDWDYQKLESLFDELKPEDIAYTGFTESEIDNLFGSEDEAEEEASDGDSEEENATEEELEPEEPDEEEKPEALKEFSIFLSFPAKEKAEAYLKERGIETEYEGTSRNITIRMEGLDYGTGNQR